MIRLAYGPMLVDGRWQACVYNAYTGERVELVEEVKTLHSSEQIMGRMYLTVVLDPEPLTTTATPTDIPPRQDRAIDLNSPGMS